jgi:hypothetical protein
MKQLIDAKKLTADLKELQETLVASGHPFLAGSLNAAIECVEKQTVFVLVECKDCRHWRAAGHNEPSGWCSAWDGGRMQDNFCVYGELKNKN